MGKVKLLLILALSIVWLAVSPTSAFAAYSSHQNDQDINNFLAVYPFAKSTKLDDCALCHQGSSNGKTGSCDYCHQVYKTQEPHPPQSILLTLNPYGSAYYNAGRSQDALRGMEKLDSDGDKFSNLAEIQALTFPGDPKDYPGLIAAPAVGLNLERILMLPGYSEFLLLNASNSRDFYARYRGIKIMDLLKYAGISKKATQITVYSPDGFSQTFPIKASSNTQYDVMGPYPYGYYYGGLDFVDYSFIPRCLDNGDRIPDKLYMLLAYMRDGDPLTPGKINPTTLKLDGEGPYRLIPPQKIAGNPDRPNPKIPNVPCPPKNDLYDYDCNNDHNAGFSARTVTAIRVDPLPAGTTDFRWTEGGWNLVDHAKLVIYGAIDPRTYRVGGKVSDSSGEGIADVKLAFSLLSLGQVGEATTSAGGRYFKKGFGGGKFSIDLPAGEYTVIPAKEGCIFTPASLSISLPDAECDLDGNHGDPRDHRERWEHCNRHPDNEIDIIGSCTP